MTVVAVTGASGYIGRRLLEQLDDRTDVSRVIAVGHHEAPPPTRNLEFYRLDVRSEALPDVVSGCDVLYHLVFAPPPYRDPQEARDVNVGGTRCALAAAARAGVRKVIIPSSPAVYGAHPDNDYPLTERSPLRPMREYSYSLDKWECEELARSFKEAHPDVTVTVFRSAVVMGPGVGGVAARVVESPVVPKIAGYDVPFQVVHETDVARALVFALDRDLDGAYNLAPPDWVSTERAAELIGSRVIELPVRDASRRLEPLWRLGLSDLEGSFLPFLMYPWVMSSEKLAAEGFSFMYSTEGTLLAAADARRGWVAIGRLRFRPRRVAAVVAGAVVVAGSLARRAGRDDGA